MDELGTAAEKQRVQNLKQLLAERAGRPFERVPHNKPCPCGSGNKFKYCCLPKTRLAVPQRTRPTRRQVPGVVGAAVSPVAAPPVQAREATVESMLRMGVEPAKIHAYRKTGLWIVPQNRVVHTPEELAGWDAAIQEYEDGHCDLIGAVSADTPTSGSAAAGE